MRVVLCVVLTIISGCAPQVDSRTVENVYRDKVNELGLVPVYPPREDVRVGDVYFYSHDGDPRNAKLVYLENLAKADSLVAIFLADLPAYDITKVEDGGEEIGFQQTDYDGTSIANRGNTEVKSLPVAAFPDISGVSGSSIGLGATVLQSALGLSRSEAVTETLSFQSVRTYAASTRGLWRALSAKLRDSVCISIPKRDETGSIVLDASGSQIPEQRCRQNSDAWLSEGSALLRATNRQAGQLEPCKQGNVCGLFVISRLYLTRQITFTYSGLAIQQALVDVDSPELTAALTGTNSSTPPTVVVLGDTSESEIPSEQEIAQALNSGSGVPNGNGISALGFDGRGVSFTQKYPRPLVIAWEGLSFTYGENEIQRVLNR